MFIGSLNHDQQAYFLAVAKKLIAADGIIDEREAQAFDVLVAQCAPGVEPAEDVTAVSVEALFDDRASRVACLLELVGIALADDAYDASERAIIQELAGTFDLSHALIEDMENWVSRQMTLVHEAQQMMLEG